ncbi:DotH/IcmK family type IV secretion protein [Cupriavidus oxalaticus]|uniref:Conjugal transfer protein TraN n=1 Tax=Cupriavidus oxalaticus TaxID=96344 RepID=A0A4P7LMN5_9BURK|nr:DotH/IcmK family type IV secretion protein [Cupriavidus oxalaticus]QBY56089.1 conjugal transfer protein TraN [Cupriavidus oxalaticus]
MRLSIPRLYALLILSITTACGHAAAQGSPGESNRPGTPSPAAGADDANAPRALPPLKAPPVGSANFNSAVDTVSPLSNNEILDLRKRVDSARRAAATYPGVPPKPVISTTTVDLSPGSTPPIVRVSNQGAAVSLVDITGAPWDILEVNNLAKRSFEVKQPAKDVPTITITAMGDYVEGNVAIFLKGLSIPVMLRMVAGQRETDYRLDLRIPRRGPNAIDPIAGTPSINLPANYLQTLLDGIDTPNAKSIRVENAPPGTRAWMVGGNMVLRTSLFLNNPAYQATIAAADGTRVYEMAPTPVATLSENGSLRNVYFDLE